MALITAVGPSSMGAKSTSIASELTDLETRGADAARVAALVAEKMQAIHSALAPIIGDRGVSALYKRSLFLIIPIAPWADSLYSESASGSDYAALSFAVSHQSDSDAVKGAKALFATIYTVLVSLIGEALTERLLHPMYNISSSGQAVQENPS